MSQPDPSLDRLLRAAAAARSASRVTEEPPFGFTTRVVAHWLGAPRERPGLDALWFRRAFLCAFAVMLLSVGWSFRTSDTSSQGDEMTIASYDATADLP
jgi:hypothetical protein